MTAITTPTPTESTRPLHDLALAVARGQKKNPPADELVRIASECGQTKLDFDNLLGAFEVLLARKKGLENRDHTGQLVAAKKAVADSQIAHEQSQRDLAELKEANTRNHRAYESAIKTLTSVRDDKAAVDRELADIERQLDGRAPDPPRERPTSIDIGLKSGALDQRKPVNVGG